MESAHLKLRSKFQRPYTSSRTDQITQDQEAPRTTPPVITMNENEVPRSSVGGDAEAPTSNSWATSTPQSQSMTPPMTTSLDSFSYGSLMDLPAHSGHHSMGPGSSVSMGGHLSTAGSPARPMSSQDFQTPSSLDGQLHNAHKHLYENQYTLQALTSDMPLGGAYTSDEVVPVVDADPHGHHGGYYGYPLGPGAGGGHDDGAGSSATGLDSRRISGSSFTMSTCGGMSDMPPYEDLSAAMSDAAASSDYPPTSARNSWMSSSHLSPVASPRMSTMSSHSHSQAPVQTPGGQTPGQGRAELVRTQSRGRASPSPRPSVRSAPYSIDGSQRNKQRWSTGTYGTGNNRRHSPYYLGTEPHVSTPPFQLSSQASYLSAPRSVQRKSMLLPTQLPSQTLGSHHGGDSRPPSSLLDTPPPPPLSQDIFRMLHSNADTRSVQRRYAELASSDPPDLFGYLSEEASSPPEEDMNPSDPDMTPREQDLRFDGDLYTPKWVRGHGNKREGWCGICKPGRWLVLKNSAYWYDKSFSHGISAATGAPFQEPLDSRRTDGNPDVWEGLCGGCNDWIALVSSKKKGTTWFRHAYKCHAHPKAKDGAKRRRENSNVRMPPAPLVKSSRLDHQPSYQSYYQPHPPHTPQQYPHSHPHSQQTPQLQSPYNPGGILPPASMGQAPPPPPMYRNSNPLPGQVQMPPALFSNDMYPNMI